MIRNTLESDHAGAEEFADKLNDILNTGALSLMISVGHRTGLFDAMKNQPPLSCSQIAQESLMNDRYVSEWLSAMVVGGIVEFDPDSHSYFLPPEHASFLTRSAAPDNVAVFAQYISILGAFEDRIVECFMNGGGISFGDHERFHDVLMEDSKQAVVLPAQIEILLRSGREVVRIESPAPVGESQLRAVQGRGS